MSKINLHNFTRFDVNSAVTNANLNNEIIEEAFDNTLSRDGSSPNHMEADIDMNSNDLLNVGNINTETLFINGVDVHDIVGKEGPVGPPGPVGPFADAINVRDFGAIGDGVSDDTAAFNAASDVLRSRFAAFPEETIDGLVVVPEGEYAISSWDLTNLRGRSVHIIGHGAKLVANAPGAAVVDALSSRWLKFYGLKIMSRQDVVARCGVQIGTRGTETCGNNSFHDVDVLGHYELAALFNSGSETTQHFGCTYVNRRTDSAAFAYVGDGATHYLPSSEYVVVTKSIGTQVSFTNNSSFASQFRNEGGGSAVFLSATASHSFHPSCYFLSYNASAFVLWQTTAQRNDDLDISGLYETNFDDVPTPGNVGIRYVVDIIGDGSATAIDGLTIRTNTPHVETSVFHMTTSGTCRIDRLRFDAKSLLNSGAKMFYNCERLTVGGDINFRESSKLNLNEIAGFSGHMTVNDFSGVGLPTSGSYTVTDSGNKKFFLVGNAMDGGRVFVWNGIIKADGGGTNVELKGRAKGEANAILGNDAYANGLIVQAGAGAAAGVTVLAQPTFPRLQPSGSAADIDLQIEGKGAGHVRFGAHSSLGSEVVTGYITIKDSAGSLRKIAVLS